MPNNISNELTIHSDNFKEALSFMAAPPESEHDEIIQHFDMNKLVPMPPEFLDSESSTFASQAHICYLIRNNLQILKRYKYSDWAVQNASMLFLNDRYTYDQIMDMGKKVHSLFEKYGYGNWYEWRVDHWGTKWNTYASKMMADNILYFESAWSPPIDMVEKFIKMFNLTATYRIMCEGHCIWGIREYKDGNLINERMNHQDDLRQLCIDLNGYDPDDDE